MIFGNALNLEVDLGVCLDFFAVLPPLELAIRVEFQSSCW